MTESVLTVYCKRERPLLQARKCPRGRYGRGGQPNARNLTRPRGCKSRYFSTLGSVWVRLGSLVSILGRRFEEKTQIGA